MAPLCAAGHLFQPSSLSLPGKREEGGGEDFPSSYLYCLLKKASRISKLSVFGQVSETAVTDYVFG